MLVIQLVFTVLIVIYSNFHSHDVDAGSPRYMTSEDVWRFFNASTVQYDSSISSIAEDVAYAFQEHARVNATQSSEEFIRHAKSIQYNGFKRISAATYQLFDSLIAFAGVSLTADNMADAIFGDYILPSPFDSITNIHDPFYIYAGIDSQLGELYNEIVRPYVGTA